VTHLLRLQVCQHVPLIVSYSAEADQDTRPYIVMPWSGLDIPRACSLVAITNRMDLVSLLLQLV